MKPWNEVSDDRRFWMKCSPACSHEGNGHCKTFRGSLAGGGFSYEKLAFKWHWALRLTKGRKLKAKGDTLSLTYIFLPFIPFFPAVQIKDRGSNWIPPERPGFIFTRNVWWFVLSDYATFAGNSKLRHDFLIHGAGDLHSQPRSRESSAPSLGPNPLTLQGSVVRLRCWETGRNGDAL